jgi:predicted nucleic acid-binding protein
MNAVEFVDTNVLVYAFDSSAGFKADTAANLIQELTSRGRGALSIQVLSEFYATITRKVKRPLPPDRAEIIMSGFESWSMHSPIFADVRAAIQMSVRYRINYWDALIIRSAQQVHANVLWSEDFSHGQHFDGVEVRNPFVAA